jgi:hypothetical protein
MNIEVEDDRPGGLWIEKDIYLRKMGEQGEFRPGSGGTEVTVKCASVAPSFSSLPTNWIFRLPAETI